MKAKLAGSLGHEAIEAISLHAPALYSSLGSSRVAIVEIASIERTAVAPTEDKDVTVTLQIKELEVAGPDQAEAIRRAMKALHTHRTAYGTLTGDLDVELSQAAIEDCAGELNAIEAARLHAAAERWSEYARRILSQKTNESDLRIELRKIADGLHQAAYPATLATA